MKIRPLLIEEPFIRFFLSKKWMTWFVSDLKKSTEKNNRKWCLWYQDRIQSFLNGGSYHISPFNSIAIYPHSTALIVKKWNTPLPNWIRHWLSTPFHVPCSCFLQVKIWTPLLNCAIYSFYSVKKLILFRRALPTTLTLLFSSNLNSISNIYCHIHFIH